MTYKVYLRELSKAMTDYSSNLVDLTEKVKKEFYTTEMHAFTSYIKLTSIAESHREIVEAYLALSTKLMNGESGNDDEVAPDYLSAMEIFQSAIKIKH